jgi:tetratricopeptide repeat protein 8
MTCSTYARLQEMVTTVQEICKIYLRMDQPNSALEQYKVALQLHPGDSNLLLGVARVYDALGDTDKAMQVVQGALFL